MTHLNRRMFLGSAAGCGTQAVFAASNKPEAHRFRTSEFYIEVAFEYHDRYASSGFWFRDDVSKRQFCLSREGVENSGCLATFRGSLAITRYKVQSLSKGSPVPVLHERVRTIDRDARLGERPPFERAIELNKGIGSDLQAFGYDLPPEEESLLEAHSPWFLFRQDLFLDPQTKPFLVIFWKHALPSIRVLDLIPGDQTWSVIP